jgi:hypothetical protein
VKRQLTNEKVHGWMESFFAEVQWRCNVVWKLSPASSVLLPFK